ncbi:MAG: transporter, partial [Paenibacillus sp.]|nr:transporter [Paenibacillus sp.]
YLGDNLFRSPIGWMIDKVGYRPVMLGGIVLTFLSVIIMVAFSHYSWIILACALLGIGTSPLWPCVITGATESVGEKANGTTMSVIYMAWLSGVGLGPVVINFFIADSYTPAFRLLIVLMMVSTVLALFLPNRLHKPEHIEPAESPSNEPMKFARSFSRQDNIVVRQFRKIRQYMWEAKNSLHVSWAFYPALFAQTFALGLLTPVLTLYARTVMNLTPAQYSMFLVAGGAITVLFLIPVGKLVDRFGTRIFIHTGLLLSALVLVTFTFVSSVAVVLALVTLLGIGYAFIIPSWNALIASVIPKEKRGAIWGFFLTIEGSGNVVGPVVSGKLWDELGHHAPFVVSGLVLLVLYVLQLFISVKRKVVVK